MSMQSKRWSSMTLRLECGEGTCDYEETTSTTYLDSVGMSIKNEMLVCDSQPQMTVYVMCT
jgi:hypothetical protein